MTFAAAPSAAEVPPDLRLRRRLPLMPQYLLLRTTPEAFAAAATRLAREQGIWTFPQAAATADPDVVWLELAVGDATCQLPPDQIADIVAALAT